MINFWQKQMFEFGTLHIGGFMIEVEVALLILMLAIASATDIAWRKIPNWLILCGLAVSLIYQTLVPYGFGFTTWLAGFCTGLVALFPFYLLRIMGAGDVKLMAAVGSFLGASATFETLLYTLASGGVLALVFIVYKRVWKDAFQNVLMITLQVGSTLAAKRISATDFSVKPCGHLPYAVAIFAGTLLHLYVFRN